MAADTLPVVPQLQVPEQISCGRDVDAKRTTRDATNIWVARIPNHHRENQKWALTDSNRRPLPCKGTTGFALAWGNTGMHDHSNVLG